jgi:ketoreductase RED2
MPAALVDLTGKVAVVTGSSSGIGEATARALAGAGAKVVISSARSVEAGQAVAAALGDQATYVQADVSDEAAARRLVEEAVAWGGRLDVLVNNAGTTQVIPHHDLEAASLEVWRRIFEVNVFGTWAVTVAAMPHLKASGDGSVVNVTSLAGVRPSGSSIPYAASKAALNHLTALLANVVGPEVRVNALAPGLVDTPWTADWDAIRGYVGATAPLGRSGSPEDMALAVLGIVGSPYMTGQGVVVDGGMHLK